MSGDVTSGYLALREDAAIVEGAHDVVWATGEDTVEFLDGLVSQSVAPLDVGEAAPSLLLAPQGKLRATLWVLRGRDRIGLVSDHGIGQTVAGDLNRFKLRVDVTLSLDPRPADAIWGPKSAPALETAGLPVPAPGRFVEAGDLAVAALPFTRSGLARFVVIGVEDLADRTGLTVADPLAAAAVRVEAGEPVMGVDIDERTIPQEGVSVDAAVDFDKGCYLGQELVARIDSRGRVNRHLRGIQVAANVLPPEGADVVAGDRVVGKISSVAESLALRAPVALSLVRREVEPGQAVELRWEGGAAPALVKDLPMDPSL